MRIVIAPDKFAPDDAFVVAAAALRHRNAVSAYDGEQLTGVVRRTWLRGRTTAGEATAPAGQLLTRMGS
jgi:allantoinase